MYLVLAIYLLSPIVIMFCFEKWTTFRKLGTVVSAYIIGIVMALAGLVDFSADAEVAASFTKIQSTIMSIAVPLAIPLMLFNCDFKLWTKALPKTLFSLLGGIVGILTALVTGYFIFRNQGIPEFEKVVAIMTGIYTGGTMNFNALGASLGVTPTTMAIVLAFEMVLTTPYIFFIIGGGFKVFRKILPYADDMATKFRQADSETLTKDIEDYKGLIQKKNWPGMFIAFLLSVLFLAIGAGLALLITGKLNELVVILTITTLSIIASFFKKIRELPHTFEMGMVLILLFSVIVASLFDIHSVNMGSIMIGAFVLYVIVVGALIHLLICRLSKCSGDLFTVSQVALLCSPPFVPPVIGAMKNKKVLLSGLVIGLIGYAIGNYLGVIIYAILS